MPHEVKIYSYSPANEHVTLIQNMKKYGIFKEFSDKDVVVLQDLVDTVAIDRLCNRVKSRLKQFKTESLVYLRLLIHDFSRVSILFCIMVIIVWKDFYILKKLMIHMKQLSLSKNTFKLIISI